MTRSWIPTHPVALEAAMDLGRPYQKAIDELRREFADAYFRFFGFSRGVNCWLGGKVRRRRLGGAARVLQDVRNARH
jgi:hypothetical protein